MLSPAARCWPRRVRRNVKTALDYWLKSKARRPDFADRLVFLRTALEALLVDHGNRVELTFRLATNGAWYTGRNRKERRQRYDALRKVYGAASAAVHAGHVKSAGSGLLKDGHEICRLAILKRLRSKQVPVWEEITSVADPPIRELIGVPRTRHSRRSTGAPLAANSDRPPLPKELQPSLAPRRAQ